MSKKLVTRKDLDTIFSDAKERFNSDQIDFLDERQFRTKCFMEAILNFLNISDIQFEKRKLNESIDD